MGNCIHVKITHYKNLIYTDFHMLFSMGFFLKHGGNIRKTIIESRKEIPTHSSVDLTFSVNTITQEEAKKLIETENILTSLDEVLTLFSFDTTDEVIAEYKANVSQTVQDMLTETTVEPTIEPTQVDSVALPTEAILNSVTTTPEVVAEEPTNSEEVKKTLTLEDLINAKRNLYYTLDIKLNDVNIPESKEFIEELKAFLESKNVDITKFVEVNFVGN